MENVTIRGTHSLNRQIVSQTPVTPKATNFNISLKFSFAAKLFSQI